jgi:hypothetical protein
MCLRALAGYEKALGREHTVDDVVAASPSISYRPPDLLRRLAGLYTQKDFHVLEGVAAPHPLDTVIAMKPEILKPL